MRRRTRQPIRRKCGRQRWLRYCEFVAKEPGANLFFQLVMLWSYGERIDARFAFEIATAGYLRRTNQKPLPLRSPSDNVPF